MADAAATAVRPRALAPDLGQLAVGAGIAAAVAALGAADGGYFPPAWAWTALVALWLVGAWLVLGRAAVAGGAAALVFLGALTGLAAWTWLSLAWTGNTVMTALEGFRTLAYVAAAAALVVVVRRQSVPALLRGALAGIAVVCLYGLATRLFPDRLGVYDPVATYRLSEPVGYWNGLGLLAAMGAILALVLAARDRSIAVRSLAGASFALLLPTIYFTFSRGAGLALAVGIVAAILLDPRRLQLVLTLAVVAVPALVGVWIASTSEALTRQDSPLSAAAEQGRELSIVLVLLAAGAAAAVAALVVGERRITPPRSVRVAFATVLVLIAAAGVAGVVVRFGGPVGLAEEAYDSFMAPPPPLGEDLGERLFTFSGSFRADLWGESLDQYEANPVLGAGAGTYEQYWNAHRPIEHKVRDAHSLYLETLGELGPLGLLLLAVALGVPILAAVRARRHPLAVGALGAYVAYLVHAAVDWDWELPVLTVAALACAAALLAARPPDVSPFVPGQRARIAGAVAALVLSVAAFVALVGFSALSASTEAATATPPDWAAVEDEARKARRWLPWSSEPWQLLGESQLRQNRLAEARRSIGEAIRKEPGDWALWYRLAEASTGAERRRALAEARRLNPRSPEIAELAGGGA